MRMVRDARLLSGETPGRRGRAAGRNPYLAGGEPVRIIHRPIRKGEVYMSAIVKEDPESGITAWQLIIGVLLGTASSILVTALLLIILLT
jgi:hypothetical protein